MFARCLFAAFALVLPLFAQPLADDKPTLFLSSRETESFARLPAGRVRNVLLRPNLDDTLYLHVRNPTELDQELIVVLATGPTDADEFATTTVKAVAGRTVRVPAPAAPPAVAGDKSPAGTALRKALHLRLLDKARKSIDETALPVSVQLPSQYVHAAASYEGDAGNSKNRLIVKLSDQTPTRPFPGPPAKCLLVVDPQRLPELIPESVKTGTYRGDLSPGGELTLAAENLRFKQVGRRGVFSLTVDNVERAFLFETDFSGSSPQPFREPRLYMGHPRYVRVGSPCPVRLEIDNAPRADAVVEFGVDRAATGRFDVRRWSDGERYEAVRVRWGQGGLVFTSEFRDRVVELDTAGVHGKRNLRLRLLDSQGRELATPETSEVIVDDTPPEVTRFLVRTRDRIRNKPVALAAQAADPESGIKAVTFFVGEPPLPDGKLPPGTRIVEGTLAQGVYSAALPTPDQRGRVTVGVRVENPTGMATTKTEEIELVDPPVEVAKKPVGSIKAKVVQGLDERLQPKIPVQLRDAKGTAVKTLETDAKGEVTFPDLDPGKYVVAAANKRQQVKAQKEVTVEVSKVAELTLKLVR